MEAVIEAYKAGASTRELAKRFRISDNTVRRVLRGAGVIRSAAEGRVVWGDRNKGKLSVGGLSSQGYRRFYDGRRYIYEHRIVAEKILGRPLAKGEVVHHKNGDRADNRPENIEVLPSQSHHMREHMTPDEARKRGAKRKQKPVRDSKGKFAIAAALGWEAP